ncbi:hypothetical protein, partial [Thiolapillus sp.]|uniref:hypothetical protein n=1 Tax=Thiolapillus sp. TaxID=2017437 RepID=UPI003AF8319F
EVSRMQQSAYRTSSNGQYEQNSNFISPENIRWNNVAYSKPESVIPERQNPHFTDMTRQEPL